MFEQRWIVIFEKGKDRLVPSTVNGLLALRPLLENEYTRDCLTFDTKRLAEKWIERMKQNTEATDKLFSLFKVSVVPSSELVLLKP